MTDNNFSTRVIVENAYYDSDKQMLCLVLFLKLLGEKRIVYCSKTDWHYHDSAPGDFPDSEMFRFAELIKGREFIWKIYDDPNCNTDGDILTAEGKPRDEDYKFIPKITEHLKELNKVFENDEQIIDRKIEDIIRTKTKTDFQQEALRRIRGELN